MTDPTNQNDLIAKLTGNPEMRIKTKLECLIELHNEQIRNQASLEVDKEFFSYLILAEPANKEFYEDQKNADKGSIRKRKLVEILKKHIMDELTNLSSTDEGTKENVETN